MLFVIRILYPTFHMESSRVKECIVSSFVRKRHDVSVSALKKSEVLISLRKLSISSHFFKSKGVTSTTWTDPAHLVPNERK